MAYLDSVKKGSSQPDSGGFGYSGRSKYLRSVKAPTAQSIKLFQFGQEAAQYTKEAKEAARFGNLVKGTIKGLPQAAGKVAEGVTKIPFFGNVIKNTWEAYKQTPSKIIDDIKEGAQ